jgi:uridine phosphorylase
VLSTGIGTGNIDIVLNELDALVNIDLDTRRVKEELQKLTIIRIGTSGAIQADIPVDSLLVSSAAVGFDSLMHYYQFTNSTNGQVFIADLLATLPKNYPLHPYFSEADDHLLRKMGKGLQQGITLTAPGFYAPQGRQIRAKNNFPELLPVLQNFSSHDQRMTNIEMETAGIYGMASALGHLAISFNIILANRVTQNFSAQPQHAIDQNIKLILEKLIAT